MKPERVRDDRYTHGFGRDGEGKRQDEGEGRARRAKAERGGVKVASMDEEGEEARRQRQVRRGGGKKASRTREGERAKSARVKGGGRGGAKRSREAERDERERRKEPSTRMKSFTKVNTTIARKPKDKVERLVERNSTIERRVDFEKKKERVCEGNDKSGALILRPDLESR
ncbi:hypothetical protein EDB85DRAFT_1892146 [Lactarius pseudohatsudake]|nr:hypothetical protein EDB85DRAFT_1892146 [Lactarius pseudohatsudake]